MEKEEKDLEAEKTEEKSEPEAEKADEAKEEVKETSTVEVLYVETPDKTVDATDPMVVVLTWALTFAAGKVFKGINLDKARHLLPMVAVLGAVALQAVLNSSDGSPLSLESLATALGAAGVAVLGHSQFRELKKAMAQNLTDEDPVTEED